MKNDLGTFGMTRKYCRNSIFNQKENLSTFTSSHRFTESKGWRENSFLIFLILWNGFQLKIQQDQ